MIQQYDLSATGALNDIHSLKNYMDCFRACIPVFRKQNWNFDPNIPSVTLRPAPSGLSRVHSVPDRLHHSLPNSPTVINDLSSLLQNTAMVHSPVANPAGGRDVPGMSPLPPISESRSRENLHIRVNLREEPGPSSLRDDKSSDSSPEDKRI